MALYEDRVFAFYRMRDIEQRIDDEPELAADMVKAHERNALAQQELEYYQDHQTFLYKHHLLQSYSLESRLHRLLKADPEGFTDELAKAKEYIRRYRYYLNRKDTDEATKQKWQQHIEHYTEKLSIMQSLISKQA